MNVLSYQHHLSPTLVTKEDAEAAAETLRQSWGLGQLCIQNMIHFLEAKGVRVFLARHPEQGG